MDLAEVVLFGWSLKGEVRRFIAILKIPHPMIAL
jgi:hypothetical protein